MTERPLRVATYEVRHRLRRRRALDERLALFAPGLFRRGAVLTRRFLAPGSGLRRALTARTICSQYEAINRGDFELAELFCAPDVEYVWEYVRGLPMDLHDVYRGPAGLRDYVAAWNEAWDDPRSEVRELIDTSGDRVAAVVRIRGRGRASRLDLDMELTEIMTLREGLLERLVAYADRSQALADLGIAESALKRPAKRT